MALNWKTAIKPVSQSIEFKKANAAVSLTPAERLASTMDNALATFKRGNKDAKGVEVKRATIVKKGNEVKFSVRYANAPLKLVGDETEFVVPADKFEEVFLAIKADALKGAFDAQLAPLAARVKARGENAAAARKSKK
ncbi:MAG TPA: hypothetical protein VJM08_03470 [Anaerolineales bacterium]|nr:hypothetical protein [Anaerolineales bacterium]